MGDTNNEESNESAIELLPKTPEDAAATTIKVLTDLSSQKSSIIEFVSQKPKDQISDREYELLQQASHELAALIHFWREAQRSRSFHFGIDPNTHKPTLEFDLASKGKAA